MSHSFSTLTPSTGKSEAPTLELVQRAAQGLPPAGGQLGVLGGSYNPITRAHLLLATAAREEFRLDEVIFVLSRTPPHKPLAGFSIEQRLEMMRLGTMKLPFVSLGLCSHGLFLDISRALRLVYPQNPKLFFITGRDAAARILTWPYPDPAAALAEMFSTFELLVCERQGKFSLPPGPLIEPYSNRIHQLRLPENLDQVSSTRVRQLIAAGKEIDDLLPAVVAEYISRCRPDMDPSHCQPGDTC